MAGKTAKDLIKKYKSDEKFHNRVGLYGGASINLAFVAVQLYGGIKYQSAWFTALAVYYAVLSIVKFYIGASINKKGKAGWKIFRIVGFIMTVLNLALIMMISIMIANPSIAIHKYSLLITVIIAIWTLGSTGLTIYEVIKTRKKNEPVPLASRLVQLIAAIVSVLMLQTAMVASISTPQIEVATNTIEQFGSMANAPMEISEMISELFQDLATSNTITGTVVAIMASGITLYMIIRGTVEGKKYEN